MTTSYQVSQIYPHGMLKKIQNNQYGEVFPKLNNISSSRGPIKLDIRYTLIYTFLGKKGKYFEKSLIKKIAKFYVGDL